MLVPCTNPHYGLRHFLPHSDGVKNSLVIPSSGMAVTMAKKSLFILPAHWRWSGTSIQMPIIGKVKGEKRMPGYCVKVDINDTSLCRWRNHIGLTVRNLVRRLPSILLKENQTTSKTTTTNRPRPSIQKTSKTNLEHTPIKIYYIANSSITSWNLTGAFLRVTWTLSNTGNRWAPIRIYNTIWLSNPLSALPYRLGITWFGNDWDRQNSSTEIHEKRQLKYTPKMDLHW